MLFCRRIRDSVSEAQYYLLIDVHENAEDHEHGTSLDVQVTDGHFAWAQNGMFAVIDHRLSDSACTLRDVLPPWFSTPTHCYRASPARDTDCRLDVHSQASPFRRV